MALRWLPPLVVGMALALPAVAIYSLVVSEETPVESTTAIEPVILPVRTIESDRSFPVSARPAMAEGAKVFSPAGGTVTSLAVGPGDTVSTGDRLIGIDGLPRFALIAAEPIVFPLAADDFGSAVASVQSLLVARGYLAADDVDGLFGPVTGEALANLYATTGWAPDIGRASREYRPERFVWIGQRDFAVGVVPIVTGQQITLGEVVSVGVPSLVSIAVTEPEDAPTVQEGQDWELSFSDRVAPYDRVRGVIDDAPSLAHLGDLVGEDLELPAATARLKGKALLTILPSSAVVTDVTGRVCVYVPDDSGFVSVEIEVSGGELGVVTLDGAWTFQSVLANPAALSLADQCA